MYKDCITSVVPLPEPPTSISHTKIGRQTELQFNLNVVILSTENLETQQGRNSCLIRRASLNFHKCMSNKLIFQVPRISSGRAFAVRTACTFSGVPGSGVGRMDSGREAWPLSVATKVHCPWAYYRDITRHIHHHVPVNRDDFMGNNPVPPPPGGVSTDRDIEHKHTD